MSSVLELQSNIMTSSSYFLTTIFSTSNERLSCEKSPNSARRSSRESFKELHSASFYLESPKWPIECQVLPQKIFHISSAPLKPEPFYVPSGTEPQPRPVGEEMGKIIYDYQPKLSVDYYCHSTTAFGTEVLQTFEQDDNTLRFESRFECGNLSKVIKVTNVYYELYLRPDMYTERHSQWYYFRIQNMKEGVLYRFSIVNLHKPDSLYRYGLKPLLYSEKNAQYNNIGWIRCGKNVSYFKNDLTSDENGSYYTLTFNLKFKYDNDTVYLAQCYPYSYTNLQNYLKCLEMDRFKMTICQTRLLCRTLAGNNIYILTISSPESLDDLDETSQKPIIFLSARVHPGETPSSYMVKEIMDFLTSDCPQAQVLRDRFIFKIIPMLNADGVIVGNSRCDLLGQDLNRQYGTVLREAFPQIYHTKVILRRLSEENRLFLYCDIHGHSRKNNTFIYGCENRRISERKLTEQIFPLMMHKNASDKFSFQSCKFKVQKSKEGTGRLFVWTLGVANSYTLEISLCGSTLPTRQQTHFHIGDYEGLGRHFCETLLDYSDPTKEQMREKILLKLIEKGSTADEPINIPISDYSSLDHSESENEPSNEPEVEPSEETNLPINTVRRQPSLKLIPKTKSTKQHMKTVLNISKASVELISIGRKHKNNESTEISTTEFIGVEEEEQRGIKIIETSPSPRSGKYPRLRRQESILAAMERKRIFSNGASLRKYSKVVFEDPFNPPEPNASITFRGSRSQSKLEKQQFIFDVEQPQSEDECDQTDSGLKDRKLVEQLSYQISTLSVSSKKQKKINPTKDSTEPPPKISSEMSVINHAEIVNQLQVKIKQAQSKISSRLIIRRGSNDDKTRKRIRRSKSQRISDANATNSSQLEEGSSSTGISDSNKLSVPRFSHQRRRVSWAGRSSESSINVSPSSSTTTSMVALNSKSSCSSSSRRCSIQKNGDSKVINGGKTIRKSVSVGGGELISEKLNPKVDEAPSLPLRRRESISVVSSTRKRKLQNTKRKKVPKDDTG